MPAAPHSHWPTSPLAGSRWSLKAMRDWLGLISQANSKRWQSPRRSVCLTFLMCRPLRKRCLVLSPSAGNAWWRRSERQTRSCVRSATSEQKLHSWSASRDRALSAKFNRLYAFPEEHWRRIRTNNPLERILREIRRRTRVVGAFPDGQSALNLAAARLRHIAGTAWSTKRYLNVELLKDHQMRGAITA